MKKKLLTVILIIITSLTTYSQYFNVDYAAGFNEKNNTHQFNDFSLSWGKIFKNGLGIGTGMGIAGARSPIFVEGTYRPNRKKEEMYYNVRLGVDYKVKYYQQFRIGYQINIKQSSIPIFIHYTKRFNKRWTPDNPERNLHLYGIGIGWRISENY